MDKAGRISLWLTPAPLPAPRPNLVLILTGSGAPPPGYAIVRHAAAAATAQGGGCACCRVPSDLVALLRRLFIDRVRGEIGFGGVVIAGAPEIGDLAMADPLVAARYVCRSSSHLEEP